MRIMAIDYGDVRTGAAFSDITGSIAGEAITITEKNMTYLTDKLCLLASEHGVGRIVVGNPKNMDGTLGARAEQSSELARLLEKKSGIPTVLWDERRTTVESHRILSEANKHGAKRKAIVDAVAATLILEGYLAYFMKNSE